MKLTKKDVKPYLQLYQEMVRGGWTGAKALALVIQTYSLSGETLSLVLRLTSEGGAV